MKEKIKKKYFALFLILLLILSMVGCGSSGDSAAEEGTAEIPASVQDEEPDEDTAANSAADTDVDVDSEADVGSEADADADADGKADADADAVSSPLLSRDDIEITDSISDDSDGGHAVFVSDGELSYSNVEIIKTGNSNSGDEADFYGENSAVFASDGGTLNLSDMIIDTNGTHANAVFSYGQGTTVNISDSLISTEDNCSGGIMTTGGGTMNASNLTIHTTGNSSAAIRSDRGGGTVTVDGGSYTTDGTGSPVIYSTADITVSDADMESTASQGVVVEGKNSVTLNNVNLIADNNTKNSDKSSYYQAVMIYQSMSGDASVGTSTFTMNGGNLTNKNGDVFFVNNTVTEISLSGANIVNEDSEGIFLRAAAAGWGSEGSNGSQVSLTASEQVIDGDMIVDDVSNLNLMLLSGSEFTGAINSDGQAGEVYVEIEEGSTWALTGDSYITSLTCGSSSIDLNGYTLYIDGEAYEAGSVSQGEAIEAIVSSGGGMDAPPEGFGGPGDPPSGGPGGEPPAKPEG